MEFLFFALLLCFAAFLLLVGWLGKNAVALGFAGVAFLILAVQFGGSGITYVCGTNSTTTLFKNYTNMTNLFGDDVNPSSPHWHNNTWNYEVNSTQRVNDLNYYCIWNFKTDAASGVTSNAGFTVLFAVLGLYLFLASVLSFGRRD